MPLGTIERLVHLSQDTQLANAELVPSHNYAGYGYLRGEQGEEVFFAYDAAPGKDFFHLREGQQVEYELDSSNTESPRAKTVAAA